MVARESGARPGRIDPQDIFGSARLAGDDAWEVMDTFARTFGVDLTGFRDYLHFNPNEPPFARTVWAVRPDGSRMPYIPIGLADLVSAANSGHWTMTYPDHRRIDRGPIVAGASMAMLAVVVIAAAAKYLTQH